MDWKNGLGDVMKKQILVVSIIGFFMMAASLVWAANNLVEDYVKESFDAFADDLGTGDKITYQGFQVNQLDGEMRFEKLSFQWAEIPATATENGMKAGAVTFKGLVVDLDLLRFENAMALLKQNNSFEFDMAWSEIALYSEADEFSLSAADGTAKGLKLNSIGNSKGLTLAEYLRALVSADKLDLQEVALKYLLLTDGVEKTPVSLDVSGITITDLKPDVTGKIEYSDLKADMGQLTSPATGLSGKSSIEYGYMQAVNLMRLMQTSPMQDDTNKNLWREESEVYNFLKEMKNILSADQNRLSEFEEAYFKNIAMDFSIDDIHVVGKIDELISLESTSVTSGDIRISNIDFDITERNAGQEIFNIGITTGEIYSKDLDLQGWVTKIEDVSAMGEEEYKRRLAQTGWIDFLPVFKMREAGVKQVTVTHQDQVSKIGLARWYDIEVTEDKTMSFGVELADADVDLEILRQEALPAFLVLSGAGIKRLPVGFDFKAVYEPTAQLLHLQKMNFTMNDLGEVETAATLAQVDFNKKENLDSNIVSLQEADLAVKDQGLVTLLKDIAALMSQKKIREIEEGDFSPAGSAKGHLSNTTNGKLA